MGNHHVRFGGGAAEKDGPPYLADALPYTRAVSTYNRTLERWESTVTPPPGQTGEGRSLGRLHPRTCRWEERGR
jgi:hypothetical protein